MALIARKPLTPLVQRRHPLARGLVGAWLFHEGMGALLRDASSRNDATIVGAPPWAAWLFGPSLTFNGISQYATLIVNAASSTLPTGLGALASSGGGYSFAAWFKTSSNTIIGTTAPWSCGNCIFEGRNTGTGSPAHAWSFGTEGGKLCVARSTSTTTGTDTCRVSSSTSVNDNVPHLGVSTVEGNAVSHYIDSKLDATGTFTSTAVGDCSLASGASNVYVQLGARTTNAPAYANFYNGNIDQLLVWNRALSAAEVSQLYADPFAPFRPLSRLDWMVAAAAAPGGSSGNIIFGTF